MPRNRRAVHRQPVDDLLRIVRDERQYQHIELPQQVAPVELLNAQVGVRNLQHVERVPHPTFVLRVEPGVHECNPRQVQLMPCDSRSSRHADDGESERFRCLSNPSLEPGHRRDDCCASPPRPLIDCERVFARKHVHIPESEPELDETGLRCRRDQKGLCPPDTRHLTPDARICRQECRRRMQHRRIADRMQRDVAQVLQRPTGVVVRWRVVRPVVLFAEIALRERSVGLVEQDDVIARCDVDASGLERLIGAPHLHAVEAQQIDEARRLDRPCLVRGDMERVGPVLRPPALDGAYTLAIELIEVAMAVPRHVVQRDEQRRLLVIDVIANAPPHPIERRVGPEPFD